MSMNNVCQSVYVSALFFVPGLTFSQVSDLLRSETVEKVKKRSDFRKLSYFSSRGDHASKTLTKRRSQIISVKKNRYTRSNSY